MTDPVPPVTVVLLAATDSAVASLLRRAAHDGSVQVLATAGPDALDQVLADIGSPDRPGPAPASPAAAPLDRPVVVVDVDRGRSTLFAVGAAAARAPVLTVSADADHSLVLAAVTAGSASHLITPRHPDELVAALRSTAAGTSVFTPGLAVAVLDAVAGPVRAPAPELTQREATVLAMVVDGLTARQIATRLVLSPRTVENHVQNVLRKLDVPNRAALVRYAVRNGLA